MLVIRLQRTGRKGHAQFRVVVQDSRRTPTSGKIVAHLGHFNPHSKEVVIDKEKAALYLKNGAQPSERVARLLKAEGVKLPDWVKNADKKERKLKNPDKLRKNRPAEPEEPKEEAPVVSDEVEAPVETSEVVDEAVEPTEAPEAVENTEVTEEVAADATADAVTEDQLDEGPSMEAVTEDVAEVVEPSESEAATPESEETDKKEEAKE